MLLDEWRKSEGTGKCPTVDAIQTACEDHVDKQRRALLGLTFTTENASALDISRQKKSFRPLSRAWLSEPRMTVMQHACGLFMSICRIRARPGVGLQRCRGTMPKNSLAMQLMTMPGSGID